MAAWRRWVHLGEKLRSSCSSCSSGERNSMADVVSIDAASIAVDTPVASSSGRSSKQFNPLREAALRPGGPIARRFFAPHPTVLQVSRVALLVEVVLFCVIHVASQALTGTEQHPVQCHCVSAVTLLTRMRFRCG